MTTAIPVRFLKYAQTMQDIDRELRRSDHYVDFKAEEDKVRRILELRDQKNVLLLGHNYMEPLVYHLSGKHERGDSLALSIYAAQTNKPIILFDGVRFMAETAKILNPSKIVRIADMSAGCSLADPFRAEDILEYKKRYPGLPVVLYINSYADAKAESDYVCTSANDKEMVELAANEFGTRRVIFLPDSYMGQNIQNEFDKESAGVEVIYPGRYDKKFGRCEVHEQFDAEMLRIMRKQHGLVKGDARYALLAHPECKPEVVAEADFSGSTSAMSRYIRDHAELEKVFLATECEMSANLAAEYPNVEFVKACAASCQHMRKITLDKILYSLEHDVYEINVDESTAERARAPIQRMLDFEEKRK